MQRSSKGLVRHVRTFSSTGLTITDPLVLYRHYVDSGRIRPDEAQYRAALEFQNLYYRVKDYMPKPDFKRKIEKLTQLLEETGQQQPKIWYSPERKTLALIQTITDEDEIAMIDAPRGLLVHGEVGSGKSMLMDMFAASLPHASKRRWHYHNFMLSVYGRIHRETQRNIQLSYMPQDSVKQKFKLQNEYVLLKIAEELVDESAILLLDEFMLPDIAAAKIVQTLFTFIFKMGGIVVATSNRLPKELYSAGFNRSQFGSFYDILQSRCVSFDMRSGTDWRQVLCDDSASKESVRRYWLSGQRRTEWNKMLESVHGEDKGVPLELKVYGRSLIVPWQQDGVAKFSFAELCDVPLAGADYITIASTFHTVILDNVPVLPLIKKNQARRLITLLDALYECRVKLIIRAEANPDDLFFPDETKSTSREESVLDQEMYSRVDLDLSSPYRPNVSLYQDIHETPSKPKLGPDYTKTSAFTGEDEQFAFKRAISRLKEMTGSDAWWAGEWTPIDSSAREWERVETAERALANDKKREFINNAIPFRTSPDPPPKFSFVHFWSTVVWGPGKRQDERTQRWLQGSDVFKRDN
ncbi:AFG1-like ATPase-domain-containing protein [Lipomyces arxii]|uniref:AFG1-like ATPase-domain-containing protein n=1 Tax=Lipomyces arxii TaxID=56418 RepID=UPI0034CE6C65